VNDRIAIWSDSIQETQRQKRKSASTPRDKEMH